jgi:hypothetical protein
LGARFDSPNSFYAARSSLRNIKETLDFLGTKNVEIVSADIRNTKQPTCVVVDPLTFSCAEKRPSNENEDALLNFARTYQSRKLQPLHVCFDLTEGKGRAPIFLSKENVASLRREYINSPRQEWLAQETTAGSYSMAVGRESIAALVEAYLHEVSSARLVLDRLVDGFRKEGLVVAPKYITLAERFLCATSIHVGENAPACNAFLHDFIREDLFMCRDNKAMIDLSSLKNFCFSGQPYDAMRALCKRERKGSLTLGKYKLAELTS